MYVMMDGKLTTAEVTKVRAITNIEGANITQVGGTALTGRDWSSDFQNLQNLDVALSTRATEATLSAFANKFRYETHVNIVNVSGGDASITQTHDVTITFRVYKGIAFTVSSPTTINIYASPDNTFNKLYNIISVSNVTEYVTSDVDVIKLVPWRYIRVEIVGTGTAGDTYDLLVVAGG